MPRDPWSLFQPLLLACCAADIEVLDAAVPTDANVLLNSGCEEGTAHWAGWHGTLTTVSPGRSGAFACQICTDPDLTSSTLDAPQATNDVSMPAEGSTWVARAWVRAAPGTPAVEAGLFIREWANFSDVVEFEGTGWIAADDTTWTFLEVTHTVVEPNNFVLDVYVGQRGQPGDCFLVDDLYLAQNY